MEPVFAPWPAEIPALFGRHPVRLRHSLHTHPLFSRDALSDLIERYPDDHYMLVHTGEKGSPRKLWQRGKIGNMSGHAVIDAVEHGRFWLNLLRVNQIDRRYQELLDQIYTEIHSHAPMLPSTYKRICGILISSPRAQVYYHFDTQGNNLWQIAGSKRVYFYPATPPFVTDELVERVTLYYDETGIPYEPWYDQYARIFELDQGTMVQWELNAPHRIENDDKLSISLTTEFVTSEIRRHVLMTSGNGLLREIGLSPRRTLGGPAYYAKAAIFAAAKRSGMLKERQKAPIVFQLEDR
jgi:hypothetical protein